MWIIICDGWGLYDRYLFFPLCFSLFFFLFYCLPLFFLFHCHSCPLRYGYGWKVTCPVALTSSSVRYIRQKPAQYACETVKVSLLAYEATTMHA
ncbi:Membrane protein US13 [Frankliniella fusca]|uniref:Membrane protein US13 n=1 Tax=Frankliniella fusca TaxID=407009 RepID=A0AAE1LGD4_9NEOP|nr:Membrane protein US13 [Frankliniella fusca]